MTCANILYLELTLIRAAGAGKTLLENCLHVQTISNVATLCDFLSLSLKLKSSGNFRNRALASGCLYCMDAISTSSWKAFRFQTYSRHSMHFLKPFKAQC